MNIKEKIIALVVAVICFLLIIIGGAIQLTKFTQTARTSIQISTAIGYLNQYSSIVSSDLNSTTPTQENANLLNNYYNVVNSYIDSNINDKNSYFLTKLQLINGDIQQYSNETPIERTNLSQEINKTIVQLESDRHNVTVPLGWNCILIAVGTIGIIIEIIVLLKKIRV